MTCGPQPVYRSLDQPRPQRTIALVWLKQRALSRPAEAFRQHARDFLSSRASRSKTKPPAA